MKLKLKGLALPGFFISIVISFSAHFSLKLNCIQTYLIFKIPIFTSFVS
jgi:hypothetical protein